MADNESPVIPMKSKAVHKFYEPIVLAKALNIATEANSVSLAVDSTIDVNNDKEVFETFVYKLAHVCDRVKGGSGSTISSITVLNHETEEGKVHYWFAANQQKHKVLEATEEYLRELLRAIDESPTARFQRSNVVRYVLAQVLRFNRPKVTHYLRKVNEEAGKCLERCSGILDDTMTQELHTIIQTVGFVLQPDLTEETFVQSGKRAIRIFEQQQSTPPGQQMATRALEGRETQGIPSKECWSELQHAINRLLAYPQSIRFMLLAKEKWPQLFQRFDVSFIESSEPMKGPCRNASLSAFNIVGRLTRKEKEIEIFRRFAEELQGFELDELIKGQYKSRNFIPIVHSEVLLLDFLNRTGRLSPKNFFNGWMYIGASKPTCKLCDYYFKSFAEINRIQVGYRHRHGNLYISWRVPDVLVSQGVEGENAREKMVNKILEKVRWDAFAIVRKKAPSLRKINDSNTLSRRLSAAGWEASTVMVDDVDDVASILGQVDLND